MKLDKTFSARLRIHSSKQRMYVYRTNFNHTKYEENRIFFEKVVFLQKVLMKIQTALKEFIFIKDFIQYDRCFPR